MIVLNESSRENTQMCMEDVSHDSEMTRGPVKLGLISLKGHIKNVFIHLIIFFYIIFLCKTWWNKTVILVSIYLYICHVYINIIHVLSQSTVLWFATHQFWNLSIKANWHVVYMVAILVRLSQSENVLILQFWSSTYSPYCYSAVTQESEQASVVA